SGITFIRTIEDWFYLAIILDLFSRFVVGWAMDIYIGHSLVLKAIYQALGRRKPVEGCLFHSDRGVQYVYPNVKDVLKEHNFK
ncbi:MAG: DDE-type integrase/transposase/recombinase, partial [Candidatus Lokiarchaeota archaeon]|nr:DDE-type integrase/transposase/recombinase [Candidatus Lokiarchaeota archaeon]